MALAFAPPIDEQGHVGDEGPVVEAQGISGLTAEEEIWAAQNLAEFMRETEPERLVDAGYLAVHDREAEALLDTALASILKFSIRNEVSGGMFHTGEISSADGVVVQTPEYSTEEYDIEHVTFGVNGHEVLLTDSGWYLHPGAPDEKPVDQLVEAFWVQLEQVVRFTEPSGDVASVDEGQLYVAA